MDISDLNLDEFIKKHDLPDVYADSAQRWFIPVIDKILESSNRCDRPVVVGVNGAQGSGKSTFGDLLCYVTNQKHSVNAISLSIDDFYFTLDERKVLADEIHPLLKIRGVPGTHDIELAVQIISQLKQFSEHDSIYIPIPRFDKQKMIGQQKINGM